MNDPRIDRFITNSHITKGVADYVVVYDITDNKERGRISKLLKGYGFRIQKSVFECRLNKRLKTELVNAIEKLAVKSGFIKIYRMEYSSKKLVFGEKQTRTPDDGADAFII